MSEAAVEAPYSVSWPDNLDLHLANLFGWLGNHVDPKTGRPPKEVDFPMSRLREFHAMPVKVLDAFEGTNFILIKVIDLWGIRHLRFIAPEEAPCPK